MADDAPAPVNGNGALKRDMALAHLLALVVVSLVVACAASIFIKSEQWDITVKVIDGLLILANTLAGGLLVKTKAG